MKQMFTFAFLFAPFHKCNQVIFLFSQRSKVRIWAQRLGMMITSLNPCKMAFFYSDIQSLALASTLVV